MSLFSYTWSFQIKGESARKSEWRKDEWWIVTSVRDLNFMTMQRETDPLHPLRMKVPVTLGSAGSEGEAWVLSLISASITQPAKHLCMPESSNSLDWQYKLLLDLSFNAHGNSKTLNITGIMFCVGNHHWLWMWPLDTDSQISTIRFQLEWSKFKAWATLGSIMCTHQNSAPWWLLSGGCSPLCGF